ncbi:MAG: tyrosine-protein phosphatase [Robiginitalea sp.]
MFNFFQKKRYLADYLEGFVDIHNHILPGIDDGAKSVEESLELIRGFGELGIQNFIATPHILQPLYPNTPETIRKAHQKLMGTLMDENMTQVSVDTAAEHMIDDSFENLLANNNFLPLKGDFILVEMSYLQPSLNFEEAIVQIVKKGLTPILAHPERYAYLHQNPQAYRKYKEQGIHFQLNMLSLGDYYGPEVQKMTRKLLELGYVDFIASDAHGPRHLNALKEICLKEKEADGLLTLIQNTIETFF